MKLRQLWCKHRWNIAGVCKYFVNAAARSGESLILDLYLNYVIIIIESEGNDERR